MRRSEHSQTAATYHCLVFQRRSETRRVCVPYDGALSQWAIGFLPARTLAGADLGLLDPFKQGVRNVTELGLQSTRRLPGAGIVHVQVPAPTERHARVLEVEICFSFCPWWFHLFRSSALRQTQYSLLRPAISVRECSF